jgi:hypothetical protein
MPAIGTPQWARRDIAMCILGSRGPGMSEWLGVPAAFVAWSFALYVYVVAPRTRGARFLVAMLITDGFAVISSYGNPAFINEWLGVQGIPWGEIHQASDWLMIAIYLPFIAMTLDSGLVTPLKGKTTRTMFLVVGGLVALSMFVLPDDAREAFRTPFYIVISVVLAWGFAAAIHSWYIADSEAKRARARAFTMAFGVRDVLWTWSFSMNVAFFYGYIGDGLPAEASSSSWHIIVPFSYEVAVIIYVPLVAYGMLRVQLFDIDLRIKRTLRRSTIAAAFVAAFFLVSELASTYLSDQLGNVLGLLCTAALMFFLDPIQRAAGRFSDAAMPHTQATPEYETYRKLQVYESAVQAALGEGGVSDRQRRVLDSLISSLGIDAQAAQQLENDAREKLE